MRPHDVRQVLVRRIAFLDGAVAHRESHGQEARFVREEASALRRVLELAGLVSGEALERQAEAVAARMSPAVRRRRDALHDERTKTRVRNEHAELVRDLAIAEAARVVARADDAALAAIRAARVV